MSKTESLDQCQRITIIGAVRAPSRYEFRENVHLRNLIECAGGLAAKAGKNVEVLHGAGSGCGKSGDVTRLNVDIYSVATLVRNEETFNPMIRAGDFIVVLESDPIFVTGNVLQPRSIAPKGPITLTRAIALAGGVAKYSKIDRIKVFRRTVGSSDRTEITVDMKAIKKGRRMDLLLQPFDIIDVPAKPVGGDTIESPPVAFDSLSLRSICQDPQGPIGF